MERLSAVAARARGALAFGIVLLLLAPAAHAAKIRDIFPEFQGRRASLGRVALLADFLVVRREGGTPVARLERSRAYADSLVPLVRDMLQRRGLQVDTTLVVSMGVTVDEDFGMRIAEGDSGATTRLANPPVYMDSAFSARPELEKRWKELNRTINHYSRSKKDPAVSLAQGPAVSQALGFGSIAILRVASWDVPIGRQIASIFDPTRRHAFKSDSFIGLTILSGEDGMIVWDDWAQEESSLKPETLRGRVAFLDRDLP